MSDENEIPENLREELLMGLRRGGNPPQTNPVNEISGHQMDALRALFRANIVEAPGSSPTLMSGVISPAPLSLEDFKKNTVVSPKNGVVKAELNVEDIKKAVDKLSTKNEEKKEEELPKEETLLDKIRKNIYYPLHVSSPEYDVTLDRQSPISLNYFLLTANTLVVLIGSVFYYYRMCMEDVSYNEASQTLQDTDLKFIPLSKSPYVFTPGWKGWDTEGVWAVSSSRKIYRTTLREVLRGRVNAKSLIQYPELKSALAREGYILRRSPIPNSSSASALFSEKKRGSEKHPSTDNSSAVNTSGVYKKFPGFVSVPDSISIPDPDASRERSESKEPLSETVCTQTEWSFKDALLSDKLSESSAEHSS